MIAIVWSWNTINIPGARVLHRDPAARDGHARRLHGARPLRLLHLLGTDADPDGAADRRLGQLEPGLRGDQVLPLHAGRLAADAGRHRRDLPGLLRQDRRSARSTSSSCSRAGRLERTATSSRALSSRLLHRICGQGADVPVPHLAAGRPRRGADRRIGHPGGGHAEDGRLRHAPLQPAALPGRLRGLGAGSSSSCRDRHHLRRTGRPRAAGS